MRGGQYKGWGMTADDATEQIDQRIRAGQYPVDSRLPTTKELAAELGLSMATIHGVMARLEERGLVYTTRGRGAGRFVARRAFWRRLRQNGR